MVNNIQQQNEPVGTLCQHVHAGEEAKQKTDAYICVSLSEEPVS